MEYFWCITAAIGAGIGTGLAGLSTATVMVPILMEQTGVYQAKAIALACAALHRDVFRVCAANAGYPGADPFSGKNAVLYLPKIASHCGILVCHADDRTGKDLAGCGDGLHRHRRGDLSNIDCL